MSIVNVLFIASGIIGITIAFITVNANLKKNHSLTRYNFLRDTWENKSKSFAEWLKRIEVKYFFSKTIFLICFFAAISSLMVAILSVFIFRWLTNDTSAMISSQNTYLSFIAIYAFYLFIAFITTWLIVKGYFNRLKKKFPNRI